MASDMTQKTQAALDMGGNIGIKMPSGEAQPHSMTARRPEIRLSIHEDLAAVESEWCSFEQGADCTVFQSFGWLSTWQHHIGRRKGVRPAIVIGRDTSGEIQFLLPLSVEPGFARRLRWLGSENSDYNAPMLSPDFSQKLGLRAFLSLWPEILELIQDHQDLRFDLIHFIRMPAMVGAQQNPFRHLPVTTHPSGAYLTHLAGDWATLYTARRSPSTRQRDRTKLNRLRKMGDVKLVTPKATEEIASSFDTLMAQKARSFAAMGVGNIFDRPGHAEFYRSIAIDPATRHIAHVSRLDVGAIAAATNLGLTFRGCYYHVLASYDDGDISRFGPGAAHLHELMRYAIETGCKVFDFTVGDEPYKRDWSDAESALFDHIAAARWRGAFVNLPLLGLIRIKRFIKQTPALWSAFCKARAFVGTLRGRVGKSPKPDEKFHATWPGAMNQTTIDPNAASQSACSGLFPAATANRHDENVQIASSSVQPASMLGGRTVVCSPHFDDAVLNCWSVLDRDEGCAVVNVFTGAPGGGFTSWYDQQNGASSSAAHMHERELEDSAALSVAGKTAVNLGLWDVQYRLRQSPLLHTIFRRVPPLRFVMLRLPFLRPMLYAIPAPTGEQIADAIVRAVPGASSFCVPAGIGGHRDHLIVRQAGAVLASRGMKVRLYADLPYSVMHGWPGWIGAPDGERKNDRASALWARHLEALRLQVGEPIRQARVVRLTPEERARKEVAVRRHASQIGSLNSGRTRGRLDEESTFSYEVYWEWPASAP